MSPLNKLIRKLIKKCFHYLGYSISKRRDNYINENSIQRSLFRLKSLGIFPQLVIDGGAASGKWTKMCKQIFPDASYLLVEPILEQIDAIEEGLLRKKDKVVQAVLGSSIGEVSFNVTPELDGSGVYGQSANAMEVKVIRLEDVVAQDTLLKLDTHGYEMPIFEGIGDKWSCIECIVVEVYGFQVSPTGKLFHEISSYLEKKGFRLFDIVDIMRRPVDQSFWQADAVYIKSSHKIFSRKGYQ